jgi:hypothetical protein
MANPNYTEFDKALVRNIIAGRNTMSKLDSEASGLRPMAEKLSTKDRYGYLTPTFRIIDRRLQALRKKGAIRFNGKTWERVTAA